MNKRWLYLGISLCICLAGNMVCAAMTASEAIDKIDAVCAALQSSFDPDNFSFDALNAIQTEVDESIDILTVLGDVIFHVGHETLPRNTAVVSPVMQHVMKTILSDTEGRVLFPDSEDPDLNTRVVIWRQCLFGGSTWIVALSHPAPDSALTGQPHLKKWAGAFSKTGITAEGEPAAKRAGSMHMLTFNAGSNFTAVITTSDRRRVFNGLQFSNHVEAVAREDELATRAATWFLTGEIQETNTSFKGIIRGNTWDRIVEEHVFFQAIFSE